MYYFRRHESGFTLIEALFQLLLLGIFANLIVLLIAQFFELTSIKDTRIEADWEICVTDINQYFTVDSFINLSDDGLTVSVIKNDEIFEIRFFNQTLWKRDKRGNETLLAGVKDARFSLNGNELLLTATLENDVKKERIFIVAQSPE